MKVLIEFSREYLTQAIAVVDSSKAPRTEDLLMVLGDEFSLAGDAASWLYDAIVVARPVISELILIRVFESAEFSGVLPEGSRQYGDYTYVVVR
jgi:hypothetical protein